MRVLMTELYSILQDLLPSNLKKTNYNLERFFLFVLWWIWTSESDHIQNLIRTRGVNRFEIVVTTAYGFKPICN